MRYAASSGSRRLLRHLRPMLTIALFAIGAEAVVPVIGVGVLHAQQRACMTDDPPCPAGSPVTVSVQPVSDTVRSNPVTVYFSVTGLTTGSFSASSTVDGTPTATPSWQYSAGGSVSGNIQLTLATGTHTVAITFCESGRSPECSTGQTTVSYQPLPAPPARGRPIVTPDRASQFRRPLMGCAGCANVLLSYQTPPYRSLDMDRSLTLVYSSELSSPTGLVVLDVNPNSTQLPDKVSLTLADSNGTSIPLTTGGSDVFYSAGVGSNHIAAQFDASSYPTNAYSFNAVVRNWWGTDTLTTQVPVRTMIVNERSSGFGSGWTVAGVEQMRVMGYPIRDAIIFVDGKVTAFPSCGFDCWSSPPGDGSTFGWSSDGQRLQHRYRDGTIVEFAADTWLHMTTYDRLGSATRYTYDAYRRLTSITDPAGQVTTITWTGAPGGASTASITTPGGRTTTVVTNSSGQLSSITDPDGVTALAVTYTNDFITSATDRLGATTTYTYDRFKHLASVTSPAVQTDDRGFASSITSIRSRELAMLPGVGLGSSTAPAAHVLPDTLWLRVASQRGNNIQVLANGAGDPTMSITVDAQGKADTTTFGYNAIDQLSSVRSTSGVMTDYYWDGDLLYNVNDHAANVSTFYKRNALGQVDTVMVNQDIVQKNTYTTDGRSLLQSSTSGDATTSFTYDALGRVSTVTDGAQHLTSYTYQPGGFQNLSSVTRNSNETTQFAYDGYGRLTSVTNAAGQISNVGYDLLNRTTTMTAPGRGTSTWAYDDLNRTRTFTDALGQSYHTVLNVLGAVVDATSPASTALHDQYRYDSDGNLSSFTSRAGRNVQIAHDILGRPISITADGAPTTTIAYDPADKWVAYTNIESVDTVFVDGSGRVTKQVEVRGGTPYTLTSGFGPQGDRQALTVTAPSWSSGPRTLNFGADTLGRPSYIGDFGGKGTTIAYNQDHQPQTITLPTGTTSSRLVESLRYLGNERLSSANYNMQSNVLNSWYSYDVLSRLQTVGRGVAGDGRYRRVTYDPAGRVSQVGDTVMTGEHPIICPPDESEACYPDVNQLIVTYTPALTESYTYDSVGNRTDRSAVITAGNRVTSFNGYTLTYDNDGNLWTKSGHGHTQIFEWNGLGQLVQVTTDGIATTFGYDGLGRRVRKTTNGATTSYLYDGDNVVMQLNGLGQPLLEFSYYPGVDHPHALRQSASGAVFYYVTEQPGHVTELVNQNNQVVNRYEYTPFGESISATEQVAQPFRFAGREFDSETGLYYNRARYYDPTLARFVSEDPIGLDGGVNQYAYAGNDPVNNEDPTGLDCWHIAQHVRGDIVCSGSYCTETPGYDYTVTICDDGVTGGTANSGAATTGSGGGSVGAAPPQLGQNIHLKALNCGYHTFATALAAVTDFYVGKGMAIGYRMGVGVAGKASAMLSRWALHEVGARYAFGSPADATMAKIGRSAAGVVFGTGMYLGTTASSGGSFGLPGYLSNYVPGLNTFNAAKSAIDVCRP